MPFSVRFESLQVGDLPELNRNDTLYTFDPRSMLDVCTGRHRYIVYCENLPNQKLTNRYIAVNQYVSRQTDGQLNHRILVPISGDPNPSLYQRMASTPLPEAVEALYACVPHPDADLFSAERNLRINCSYNDFVRYNDKIAQKDLLGELSPRWQVIQPKYYPFTTEEDCYFKRQNGAGGFATFHSSDTSQLRIPSRRHPAVWFREETVEGNPCSVQIHKQDHEYVIFGYSEMRILDHKVYTGGLMKRISAIREEIRPFIVEALKRLEPLLLNYNGFLGLDFMERVNEISILEANVRVTMATFATLDLNAGTDDELPFYRFR